VAIEGRTVFLADDGQGVVGVLRHVRRGPDDGCQTNTAPERVERERPADLAAREKRVEALRVGDPIRFRGDVRVAR
jgi:hypothetical protein